MSKMFHRIYITLSNFASLGCPHCKLTPVPIILKETILLNCKFITIEKNVLTKNVVLCLLTKDIRIFI